MTKTTVDVDREVARQAQAILGTRNLRETIHAALEDVVDGRSRLDLVRLLSQPDRFDFDRAETAWGADE